MPSAPRLTPGCPQPDPGIRHRISLLRTRELPDGRRPVSQRARVLYPPDPGEAGWIGSLQPDRLAEQHTLHELTASPDLARAWTPGRRCRR